MENTGMPLYQPLFQRGEPALRPSSGHIVVSRTSGMAALEDHLRGHALYANIMVPRRESLLLASSLIASIRAACGIDHNQFKIEVASPPDDFFLTFVTVDQCMRVFEKSDNLRCNGNLVNFTRWYRGHRAKSSKFEFITKMSFDDLPEDAWEFDAMSRILNGLDGSLISMLPTTNRRSLEVYAWLRDPTSVPREVTVEIPEPDASSSLISRLSDILTLSAPDPPRTRHTYVYSVFVHVKEVLDRHPFDSDLPPEDLPDDPEFEAQVHVFPTWPGMLDGTGEGSSSSNSGGPYTEANGR